MRKVEWEIVFCLTIMFMLTSCSQQSKMKKIAIEAAEKECPNYKFESFDVIDTITVADYKDSIISLESGILTYEMFIEDELKGIGELKSNQEDCIRERRKTLSWLKSTYDRLIKDYDDLIEKRQKRIDNYKEKIRSKEQQKEGYDNLISVKEVGDSIIYFVTLHKYDCGGGTIEETICFDTELNIQKKQYKNED